MSDVLKFTVAPEAAGTRLDVFLAQRMADWSRSQIQRLIRSGLVTVESKVPRKGGMELRAGQCVSVRAERAELRATSEELPLSIIYEDSDLVVVDKPAGMTVHVGAGVRSGTLVNALLHHIGKLSTVGGELRPGIVHRLDKLTSGLIVVAKSDFAHRHLAAQFKSRAVRKTYTVLVHGRVKDNSGLIDKPIGRDPVRRVRMKVGGLGAREALTLYRVVRRFPQFTLLEVEPRTGRTHQIRVHFASVGHPIVGDTLYGAPRYVQLGSRETPTLSRNFLHASRLEFRQPRREELLRLHSPLPDELERFLRVLNAEPR